MCRSINSCTNLGSDALWGLCTLHLPVLLSAEPSQFRWCYLHCQIPRHIFVLVLIRILFFKIQVFSDKSTIKAARVECHMCVPTSLLGHLYCPNNGNRAFSAQQSKNYLLQVQYVIHSLLALLFVLWMAVLFSPFVYGNIENYKEIESQSWHMSCMRFNSTSDSMFQISSFHYFSKWEIIWFAEKFFTKTNNKKEKSNTLCLYIDVIMRDAWK